VALVRLESDSTFVSQLANIELATADLLNESALTAAMAGCDTVFHLAAKVHAPPDEPLESFARINVDGTRAVINAAVAAGVRNFIFFSTVAVYPEREEIFDEDSPVGPSTAYGATKLAGEAMVMEKRDRMRVTILRLPVVYGSRGDRGNVAKMVAAIARRRFVIPGDGSTVKTMVAVGNVIDAAVLSAADDRAAGKIYIVTDIKSPTLRDIVSAIGRHLKMRSPLRVPLAVVSAVAGVADRIRGVVDLPLTRDQVQKLSSHTRYSGAKIQNELGFKPRVSLDDGIGAAVSDYRARKT
jgi:UDP-glucose 4-epimerase